MSRRNRRNSPPPAPPPPVPIQDENVSAAAAAVLPIAGIRTDTQHPSAPVGKTVSNHGQHHQDDSADGSSEARGGSRTRSVVIPAGSSHDDGTHFHAAAAPTDITSIGTLRQDPRQARGRSKATPEQSLGEHGPSQRVRQNNRQHVQGASVPPYLSDSQLTAGDLVSQSGVRTVTGQAEIGAHSRPQRLATSSSSRYPAPSPSSQDQRRRDASSDIAQQTEFNDVLQSHQEQHHEGIASEGHRRQQPVSPSRRSASPSRTSTASAHPRRSLPLRSLTPSSSLPNLPSSEASAPIDQLEGAVPSSSSSSTLPTSHSYPFLAEPPPERASVRQKRRLASMPSGPPGRRTSRSRSPPATIPASPPRSLRPRRQSRSSPRRVVSSSSSSSKREREEPDLEQQSSAAAGGRQGSSKRIASGSSVPTASRRIQEEEDDDDRQKPDPDPTAPSSHPPMDIQGRKYEMIIMQQPTRGCAFGSNLLSRLPCAPPLIVQLKVKDEDGNEVPSDAEEPYLVCHASLFTSEGQPADLISPVQSTHTSPSGSTSHQVSPPVARAPSTSASARRSSQSRRESRGGEGDDQPSGSGTGAPAPASTRSRQGSSATATSSGTATLPRGVPSTPVRMLYGSLAATAQRFNAPPEELSTSGGAPSDDPVPATATAAGASASAASATPSSSPPSPRKPYFIFPEICVRARGHYQLKLSLMRLPRRPSSSSSSSTRDTPTGSDLLASTFTLPFEVFLAHEYTVPYVTDLTRFFARQGAALPLPSGD